ncbi:hypothetical protein BDF19DRAFT_462478 [Syncephalis fuscata]|nr:hypothetical protein BDF19DRAFT_462478 [Syncephalis fuscata]
MTSKHSSSDSTSLLQLAQIFDTVPVARLRQVLVDTKGDVDRAAEMLLDGNIIVKTLPLIKQKAIRRKQVTLHQYTAGETYKSQRLMPAFPSFCSPSNDAINKTSSNDAPNTIKTDGLPSVHEKLRWLSVDQPESKQRRQPTRTVELYRPEDIKRHTPCELILDFLPVDLANVLLKEMLVVSQGWKRNRRWLFDREIVSPHTSAFFVHPEGSWTRKKECEEDDNSPGKQDTPLAKQTEEQHWDQDWNYYSGQRLKEAATFSPSMIQAAELVQKCVNKRLNSRKRYSHESNEEWFPSVAASNCYASAKESVDWHSDTLTYLGPMPTIASLSLGAGRPFRLQSYALARDQPATYSVYLPHNSLLLMHPPTQEQWRHQVPAAPVHPHPLAGSTRINITYRHYRQEQQLATIPRCLCNLPCQLKSVTRKEKTFGRYFYCCKGAYSRQGRQCNFFAWWEQKNN